MAWLLVAIGGALGSLLRYSLNLSLGAQSETFPWATFTANACGSFFIGFIFILMFEKNIIPIDWKPFLMVGLLGAFTTFSSFSIENIHLFEAGEIKTALVYMLSSLLTCLVATFVGISLANKFA